MREFVVDRILGREDICNLKQTADLLVKGVLSGKNQVFYGKRNTGKTSLVRSVVFDEFCKKNPRSMTIFVDLLAVRSLEDIAQRIVVALSHAFSRKFPTQTKIKNVLKMLTNLEPKLALDSVSGEIALTLGAKTRGSPHLSDIFAEIANIHREIGVVVAFDEFQDIALVEGADAALRSVLQEMPKNLPFIMLGSKKHMLSRIFAAHGAPLANWGRDVIMPDIATDEYQSYINERIKPHGMHIGHEETLWLQARMRFIPEAINMVCISLIDIGGGDKAVTRERLVLAIHSLLDSRVGRFEENLSQHSEAEVRFLRALAVQAPVKKVTGVEFLRQTGLSSAGLLKIVKKLENSATIYAEQEGYFISDPLLAEYLIRYRPTL